MDSTEAVRKVLNGEKPGSGKPPKPHKDEEKGKDRHSADKHKRDKENRVRCVEYKHVVLKILN